MVNKNKELIFVFVITTALSTTVTIISTGGWIVIIHTRVNEIRLAFQKCRFLSVRRPVDASLGHKNRLRENEEKHIPNIRRNASTILYCSRELLFFTFYQDGQGSKYCYYYRLNGLYDRMAFLFPTPIH